MRLSLGQSLEKDLAVSSPQPMLPTARSRSTSALKEGHGNAPQCPRHKESPQMCYVLLCVMCSEQKDRAGTKSWHVSLGSFLNGIYKEVWKVFTDSKLTRSLAL